MHTSNQKILGSFQNKNRENTEAKRIITEIVNDIEKNGKLSQNKRNLLLKIRNPEALQQDRCTSVQALDS